METELLRIEDCPRTPRQALRNMGTDEWIETHASGTLRKNKRLGFAYRPQYLHERCAWEYGHVFEVLPRSRVTFGDPITEGDCKPVTEAGWFIDRYMTIGKTIFPKDYYECKYIFADRGDGTKTEGVGIVVRATCSTWLPAGHILFAIVAEYDPHQERFLPAQNPL